MVNCMYILLSTIRSSDEERISLESLAEVEKVRGKALACVVLYGS